MFVSLNWVARHVDLSGVDFDELVSNFTLTVAEVDGATRYEASDHIVVGKVLEATAVEGTKLKKCLVDVGRDTRQIVCGAANVGVGQHVIVALPGAKLGEIEIAARPVRNIDSFGMICSESELGIGEGGEGILVLDQAVEPGTRLSEVVRVEDVVWDIDNKSLTHRPDLWGHRGIAREIAAMLDRPLLPLDTGVTFGNDEHYTIDNQAPGECRKYCATSLEGIRVGRSPLWLRVALHRVGVRALSNVVDVTNFVMLDLGNPLHAFDADTLKGNRIVVRHAKQGELFTTLDGVERTLESGDLLIADESRALALAGIMGGLDSEISDATERVVLEAASFDPKRVRVTAQRLGLRSEASMRFEKDLDPLLPEQATRAFIKMLGELVPGMRVTSKLMASDSPPPAKTIVNLRLDTLDKSLGMTISQQRVTSILEALEFKLEEPEPRLLKVEVPSFRATKDITQEVDLIEEVGRYVGFNNIVPTPPQVTLKGPDPNRRKRFQAKARSYLAQVAGLDEVVTYSFGFDPFLDRIGARPAQRCLLKNPISQEMVGLRRDLATGLILCQEKNATDYPELGLFEVGRVFHPASEAGQLPEQPTMLGMLIAKELDEDPDASLFLRLKQIVLGLARALERHAPRLSQGGVSEPWAHPVRQARLWLDDRPLGYIAELHPETRSKLRAEQVSAVCELNFDSLLESPEAELVFNPLPRFPAVFRAFAVVVDEAVSAESVEQALRAAHRLVENVSLQSVFRGAGIEPGKKSFAWSVTLRNPEATLDEAAIREIEAAVWKSLHGIGGKPR